MKTIRLLAMSAMMLCLIGTSAFAQNVSMAGQATDIQGAGVPNALVEVLNGAGRTVGTARTGADGQYTINNIRDDSASFSVRFSKVGRVGDTLQRVPPNSTGASLVMPEDESAKSQPQCQSQCQTCCQKCRRCRGRRCR
jgi:hypothetical protein